MTDIRLFSYKLTSDSGFAPNPFWGSLTLATCKPSMRKSKVVGDWIAGFTSLGLCGDRVGDERLVYLMRVNKKPTIADYFRDERFASKIPKPSAKQEVVRAGDNIYRPLCMDPRGWRDFEQLPNPHHQDGRDGCGGHESRKHDVSGWFVLISTQFAYFGRNALHIPFELRPDVPRGQSSHGSRTYNTDRAQAFVDYVFESAGDQQVVGPPHAWPAGDESWRTSV
jgi:hypothetical protein